MKNKFFPEMLTGNFNAGKTGNYLTKGIYLSSVTSFQSRKKLPPITFPTSSSE